MQAKKSILMILDGWGLGVEPNSDAIKAAHTPVMDHLWNTYPHSTLVTHGESVGLPDGQMGNSEVGHLNLGAGRVVYQELQRVNLAVKEGTLAANPALVEAMEKARSANKKLHFIGLVSDGGVHSHLEHIKALSTIAHAYGIDEHFIHAFTDGRDTDPKSGLGYLEDLQQHIRDTGGKIASVIGRYYAMDRDKRWERVKVAYDALVKGQAPLYTTQPLSAIQHHYENGVTDEFLTPIICTDDKEKPLALIEEGDVVVCFNFRTDRCREITQVLTQQDFPELEMNRLGLHYVTMTEYDKTFQDVQVIFTNDNLDNTLGEALAANGCKQLRIAETEKYPHVTFFFSGGKEAPFEGEHRILIPSPKSVATYDQKPEMSAIEITEALIPELRSQTVDFVCLNFANADMVGHTGVWEAAIIAAETVDACVGRIISEALDNDYALFILADHGNSDYLINADGTPNTAHTLNPVPFLFVSQEGRGQLKSGKLGDVAPTILHYMNLPIPTEMTGDILLSL